MKMKKSLSRIFEGSAYVAVAVVMAFAVSHFIYRPQLVDQKATTTRPESESLLLQAYLGKNRKAVALVEFLDFECPPCQGSWPKVKELLKRHPEVDYRPMHFPLEMHKFAVGAAVASEIARDKGKFDTVFDQLLSQQVKLDVKSLNAYLSAQGIEPLVATDKSEKYQKRVAEQRELGMKVGVNGTPTLLVLFPDGRLFQTHSIEAIETLIEKKSQ